jgi:hypothetical protein
MQGVGWLSQREGILGSRFSYEHMGEEGGINPIVWNAKRAELYHNLSMHHSGFSFRRLGRSIQNPDERSSQFVRPQCCCTDTSFASFEQL